ncbi:MAG TPA: cupin domain-containing protein [Pyrinomonadaceae bacterium]
MKHTTVEDDIRATAAAYALGALTQHEARSFEEHLSEGCEACAEELREFERVTNSLAWGTTEVAPPAGARERLMARLGAEAGADAGDARRPSAPPAAPSSLHVVRADEGEWIRTADAGVFVKLLYVDRERDTVTTLVRMQPGARIAPHRHLGVEQCLVLEGDVSSAGHTLGAGDFNCALPGSVHDDLTTEGGALLLLVSPESYELMQP